MVAVLLWPTAALPSEFFVVWPGHPDAPPISGPRDSAVDREWEVAVDMRGIPANTAAVTKVNVRLPDGDRAFVMRRFSDIAGFELVGEDDFRIRPDARDDEISYNWYGEAGAEQMTIAVHRGVMSATITGGSALYSLIRRVSKSVFQQIDVSRIPPSLEPLTRPSDFKRSPPTLATAPRTKSAFDTVDVLIVHTPAALAEATIGGDVANMNARVAESFLQIESALAPSGMDSVRVRNVLSSGNLSVEVPYNEVPGNSCTGTNVNVCRWIGHRIWLRTDATVAALRDTYGADLVVMLVGDQAGVTGIAYVQNLDCGVFVGYEDTPGCGVGAAYEPFAFAVVTIPFASSFQVLAHEVGHQFGMHHQTAPGESPAYPWSYAKTSGSGTIQTVVGGMSLIRSIQYSNPNVPFIGTTEPSGETLQFNARTGACLAPVMSGFRTPGQVFRLFVDGFESPLVPPLGC